MSNPLDSLKTKSLKTKTVDFSINNKHVSLNHFKKSQNNRIIFFEKTIWMQHWRHPATNGTEFWISCKRPAFLNSFSPLQVIQNERPRCLAAAYVTARYYLCYLVLVFRLSKGLDICSDDKDAYLKGQSKKEKSTW